MTTATETPVKAPTKNLVERVEGKAVLRVNTGLAGMERLKEEQRADIKKSIGSSFKLHNGSPTSSINIPFTKQELEIIMPLLTGVDIQDRTKFNLETQEFWKTFEVTVSYNSPKILDISYTVQEVAISDGTRIKMQIPDMIDDWVIYRHCLNSNLVYNKNKNRELSNCWVIIEDEQETIKEQENILALKMEADKEYLRITEDKSNIETLEAMIKVEGHNSSKPLKTLLDKKSFLYNLKDKNPKHFLAILKDKNLNHKAKIYSLTEYRIINNSNGIYSYNGSVIGNMEEMIAYLVAAKNATTVTIMEEQLLNAKNNK